MNHPTQRSPHRALWPDPPGCTGWHLWQLTAARTGATQTDYLRAFHRYNVLNKAIWKQTEAAIAWRDMERGLLEKFDVIVLLGNAVKRAVGLRLPDLYMSDTLVCLPHPSGLNRWYNDPINRAAAEIAMEEVYTHAVGR